MAKIFVTGGAGFIGSHTIEHALKAGHEITVYDKKSWVEAHTIHHLENQIHYIEGDILDSELLTKSMAGHTHVLHLAAIVSVQETLRDPIGSHAVNVTGTQNVFDTCRVLGVKRLVYASSAAVYGAQEVLPIRESAPAVPTSPYGAHKLVNDIYARMYTECFQQSMLGLRYFNVFGVGQDPQSPYSGVISIFSARLKEGLPITVYGDGTVTRDFVSVHDIARANVSALESSVCGVSNIGTGVEVSLNELIHLYEEILGIKVRVAYEERRSGDIMRSCASTEHAQEVLGFFTQHNLKDSLRELIATL